MKAWQHYMDMRLHGLEPAAAQAYLTYPHDVKPSEIYRDDDVRVIAFPVKHRTWGYAYGYQFEAKDKVVVFSGDTTYSDATARAAAG